MIARETIEAVKERADIVQVIGEQVQLRRQGRRLVGLCPFHKEKTPSFSVNADAGFFYCFGCKENGSAIDYVMKTEGLSFPESVRHLAERFGVPIEETGSREEREERERRRRDKDDLYGVSQLAATFFESQLDEHPLGHMALEELSRRGIPRGKSALCDEVLSAFRIGYAPYGWDGLSTYLRHHGIRAEAAAQVGLVGARRSGSGHFDLFRHRLMFAVVDKSGRVVAFSGRALAEPEEDELRQHRIEPMRRQEGRDPPKYINSTESPIYTKGRTVFGLHQARHAIRQDKQAIVVEGNFDVVALHARGVQNVVAPLGTAFTTDQAKLIKRYAPTVVALFDGDAAGRKAAMALRGPAREAGLSALVASVPDGVDPDDLVRTRGVEALKALVGGARGMLEYLIEETLTGGGGGTMRDRQERIGRVMKFLAEEDDPNIRQMAKAYADRISAQMVVDGRSPSDLRALEQMVRQATSGGPSERAPEDASVSRDGPSGRSRPRIQQVSLAIFGALLEFPELLREREVDRALAVLEGDVALAVAALGEHVGEKNSVRAAELLDLLPPAVHSFAAARLASYVFEDVGPARTELLENAKKLWGLSYKGNQAARVEELSRAAQRGDSSAEDSLLEELSRRAKEKRGLT